MQRKFRIRFGFSWYDNRKSKTCPEPRQSIQNRKWAEVVTLAIALTVCGARTDAQQQAKVPKIGLLGLRPAASSTGLELFRQALGKLGYVEDKNIAFEYQSADNKFDRLPALADELVRLKVDVIVTPGT